jgi:RHS repeat-associated protein
MDIDAKGRPTASYSYGLGLTGITAGRFKGFYHADMLGSITEITGKEGNPLRSYRYSAWGDITSGETAHDVNPFRYVGAYGVRWQDSTLGMYHMNRRFYNPCAGRFISRDLQDPHPYAYALSNPIIYVDPSGRSASLNPQTVITAITIMISQPETVPVIGTALITVYVLSQAGDPHQNANTVYSSISGNDSYSGGNVIPFPNSAPVSGLQPSPCVGGSGDGGGNRRDRCHQALKRCNDFVFGFFANSPGEQCRWIKRCRASYRECVFGDQTKPVEFKFPPDDGAHGPPNIVYP